MMDTVPAQHYTVMTAVTLVRNRNGAALAVVI